MTKKKTNLTAAIIILIGGLITAFGVFLAAKQAINDGEELDKKNKKIIELTEENANLTKQALDQITGGNSWAYLQSGLQTIDGIAGQSMWTIIIVGKIPMYDVEVTLSEIEHNNKPEIKSYNSKPILREKMGTVTPSIIPDGVAIINLPNDKNKIEYLIKIKARNGEITQQIILIKKQNNYWTSAQKIFRYKLAENGAFRKEILTEKKSHDFPKEEINWID